MVPQTLDSKERANSSNTGSTSHLHFLRFPRDTLPQGQQEVAKDQDNLIPASPSHLSSFSFFKLNQNGRMLAFLLGSAQQLPGNSQVGLAHIKGAVCPLLTLLLFYSLSLSPSLPTAPPPLSLHVFLADPFPPTPFSTPLPIPK